jgi:hypothetical protein
MKYMLTHPFESPLDLALASTRWPRLDCTRGETLFVVTSRMDGLFDGSRERRLHLTALQRVLSAFVQAENIVVIEYLPVDLQAGSRQKLGREFLDGETDGVGGARKSPVTDGIGSPWPAAAGWGLSYFAPGGKQFGNGAVVKRHWNPPVQGRT